MGARFKLNECDWTVVSRLFADDTVLLADSVRELQNMVDKFYRVCVRRKLRVNAVKSKVMVFDREEVEVLDSCTPYKVNVPVAESCDERGWRR